MHSESFLPERYWSKVDRSDDCWLWLAAVEHGGYGRYWVDGMTKLAHRVSYEALVGEIPVGLTLDHLCRNRRCVNPAHLDPVTRRENTLRGEGITATNARKTHCLRGHPLSEENLMRQARGRTCRTCWQASKDRSRDRARSNAA